MSRSDEAPAPLALDVALRDILRRGYQPMYNGRPSCPFCLQFVDAEETHSTGCVLVAALAPQAPDAAEPRPMAASGEYKFQCGQCGDWLLTSELAGHMYAEGRKPPDAAEPRHAFAAGVHDGAAVYCAHCGLLRAHPAHREPAP